MVNQLNHGKSAYKKKPTQRSKQQIKYLQKNAEIQTKIQMNFDEFKKMCFQTFNADIQEIQKKKMGQAKPGN